MSKNLWIGQVARALYEGLVNWRYWQGLELLLVLVLVASSATLQLMNKRRLLRNRTTAVHPTITNSQTAVVHQITANCQGSAVRLIKTISHLLLRPIIKTTSRLLLRPITAIL